MCHRYPFPLQSVRFAVTKLLPLPLTLRFAVINMLPLPLALRFAVISVLPLPLVLLSAVTSLLPLPVTVTSALPFQLGPRYNRGIISNALLLRRYCHYEGIAVTNVLQEITRCLYKHVFCCLFCGFPADTELDDSVTLAHRFFTVVPFVVVFARR